MEIAAAAGPERLALEFLGRVWGPAHELTFPDVDGMAGAAVVDVL